MYPELVVGVPPEATACEAHVPAIVDCPEAIASECIIHLQGEGIVGATPHPTQAQGGGAGIIQGWGGGRRGHYTTGTCHHLHAVWTVQPGKQGESVTAYIGVMNVWDVIIGVKYNYE